MQPGRMDKRITFWRLGATGERDLTGADEIAETEVYACWAEIVPRTGSLLSGREAGTLLSKTTHRITIRWTDRIDSGCWIMYGGHRFDIDYISQVDFDKRYLEIFAQEVV